MLVNRDTASSSSNSMDYEPSKNDYCLCLAIHAPRKGIVEVLFSTHELSLQYTLHLLNCFFDLLNILDCQLSLGLPNVRNQNLKRKLT